MKDVYYIPLGTRCSSCSIIDGKFGLRKFALPFDWIDIPVEALRKFFLVDDVDSFCDGYFNLDNISHQRSKMDNAWFPHHLHDGNNVEAEVLALKEKFSRRLKRLHELLKEDAEFVFLTTWGHAANSVDEYYRLLDTIRNLLMGNPLFISINLTENDFSVGKVCGGHVNIRVPLGETWEQYDIDAANRLRTHEITKQYFQ